MSDALLERIASELEQPNFGDMHGVLSKRKRDREDAELRGQARLEQRRELAGWVRSFKTGEGNDPLRFVRSVASGDAEQYEWGPEVAAALAARLVTMTVEMDLNTHLRNCPARFRFALTKDGDEFLAKQDTTP